MSVNEADTRPPKQFLADLVQAMGEAARTERQATIDQCESEAKSYTEYLRARKNGDAANLHKAAVADVGTIRKQSKAAEERIRIETEERISRRQRQLEDELQEYQSAIETELHRVGERVQAFEAEVAQFFEQLLQGSDPASFVTMAARLPDSPVFVDPDPGTFIRDLRLGRSQAMPAESVSISDQTPEEVPDHWWRDSPTAPADRARSKPGSGQPG